MKPRYLFDSHALLAYFQKEEGAEVVAEILTKTISQDLDRLICSINLGEILYLTERRFGDINTIGSSNNGYTGPN